MDREQSQLVPGRQRVLVVDNDSTDRSRLSDLLRDAGYTVFPAADGPSALRAVFSHHPHLTLLSLTLPTMDGWTVLERIHEMTSIPVIVISKHKGISERLRAFELHAQGYITKPLDERELILSVKALLDRQASAPAGEPLWDDGVLRIDGWQRTVTVRGSRLAVTGREMRILALLARQPGRLLTYNELTEALPSLAGDEALSSLRTVIYRLRRRLDQAAPGCDYILTQRGMGIRLNVVGAAQGSDGRSGARDGAPGRKSGSQSA